MDDERPKTFGDCANIEGACPWISCKYHMLLDVNKRTGSIQFNVGAQRTETPKRGRGRRQGYRVRPNLPVITLKEMASKRGKAAQDAQDDQIIELLEGQKHTCVLKVIKNDEPLTLDAVGEVMSLTRERVRQIQTKATNKLREEPGCLPSLQ